MDGQHVVIGVTGGIACYKMGYVVSRLAQRGADVTVCMTEAAREFVGPATFEALSSRPVMTTIWDHLESSNPQHIETARAADLMVIAPCTMNMLGKLAHGLADDPVSLVAAAVDRAETPVLLAPAMNEVMWSQPSTQRSVAQLRADGFDFVGPESGWQACRTSGAGRMSEPDQILEAIDQLLERGPAPPV